MKRALGPILFVRQGTQASWSFSIGLWVDDASTGALTLSFSPADGITHPPAPRRAGRVLGRDWLLWEVDIARGKVERRLSYRITGLDQPCNVDNVVVPAMGQAPRIAFFSCNGVQDPRDWTSQPEMERVWQCMLDRHTRKPGADGSGGAYHVLIGGGDQIYCDAVWRDSEELSKHKSWKDRQNATASPKMAREIEAVYARLYARWRDSKFKELHSRIPGAYTWDDHDIFDGWGSYDDKLQDCQVFKKIFEIARSAFVALQLGQGGTGGRTLCLDPSGSHFLQAIRFDDRIDVLLLDLRSQRRLRRVMAEDQWRALHRYLEVRSSADVVPPHLLVVSSIPLVYLNFAAAEKFLDWFPWRQDLEDDLHDQWESASHQQERGRLIMTLLDHAQRTSARVTVLSGDVHVGARGRIVSRRPGHLVSAETQAVIHQLTSSGIVFPPPGALALAGMRAIAKDGPTPVLEVTQIETEVLPVSAKNFLLGRNNWLSIEPDAPWDGSQKKLWVRWITDKEAVEPPIVIHKRV